MRYCSRTKSELWVCDRLIHIQIYAVCVCIADSVGTRIVLHNIYSILHFLLSPFVLLIYFYVQQEHTAQPISSQHKLFYNTVVTF